MKRLLLIGLAGTSLILADESSFTKAASDVCAQNISISWYNPRSTSFNAMLNEANSRYNWVFQKDRNNQDYDYSFSIKPFAQISNNSSELAKYFTPNNQESFTLREGGTGDVNPAFFLLSGPNAEEYNSTVSLAPTRRAFGFTLDFKKRFNVCNRRLWLDINTALINARHNLHVNESNRSVDGNVNLPPLIKNACNGFNDSIVKAKLPCKSINKTSFDDIIIKLGYDLIKQERRVLSANLLVTLPTRARNNDTNLFDPIIGSDAAGFGAGLNFNQILKESKNCRATFMSHANFRYVTESNQRRTFDLTNNGNWSRYLIFAHRVNGPETLPGNTAQVVVGDSLLNLEAKVRPGFELNWLSYIHLTYRRWDFEAGYNVWYRQGEQIKLNNKKCPTALNNWGILDIHSYQSTTTLQSSSTATISQSITQLQTNADSTFTTITDADLNLQSAAHPEAVTYSVFATAQYSYCANKFVNVGFGYEASKDRNAIENFHVWMGLEKQF